MAAATQFDRDKPSKVAVDTETTGLEWLDVPFCITLAWQNADGITSHYLDLDSQFEEAEYILSQIPTLVMHNAKFDMHKLIRVGLLSRDQLTVDSFEDTQILAHVYNEYLPLGLKPLAEVILGESTDEASVIKAEKKRLKLTKKDGYDKLPVEVVKPYALKDAEFTYKLYKHFSREIATGAIPLGIYNLEKEFCLAILDVERAGVKVDTMRLDHSLSTERSALLQTELDLKIWAGDEEFNPNSPIQVKSKLEDLGIHVESTGKDILSKYSEHPFVGGLLDYRRSSKIVNTYLENIKEIMDEDCIVHPWFRINQTRTGRISSGKVEDA